MGPSLPTWGLMKKTTEIIRSKPLPLFIYVMSFTFDFGAFDEDMVVSLTI